MDMDKTMSVYAGIGCRSNVSEAEIVAAIDAALAAHALECNSVAAIATSAAKGAQPAVAAAGLTLGMTVIVLDDVKLRAADAGTLTRSERSLAKTGLASLSEAAALAAAGRGSRLLGPRLALGPVTCALAVAGVSP